MRLLALAIAALALLAWLNVRDLLRRQEPVQPDPADDVQPADPVTVKTWHNGSAHSWHAVAGDMSGWCPDLCSHDLPATLSPLTAADRDWLDQTVRSHLHPAT